MKLRTLLLISTAVLTLTVSSIAFVTIYYLNSMDDLQKESQRLLGIRVEALNVKYFVVNIQQFLTDASVTGDEDGVKEAEENLITLNSSLDNIDQTAPEFKKSTESIRKDLKDFFQVGLEMVAAYKKHGQEAGNSIMKRSPDGFDMASEKLAEHMSELEKKATEVQNSAMGLMASRQHSLLIQSIWLSIIELLIMMAIFLVIFRRTFPLGDVASGLGKNEKGLESALNTLSKSAHALSGANERQALATQQTVASLDEIRALVKTTFENSSSLQERALETNHSVQVGKDALDAVISTIQEINKGQREISESVGQTNQEISNIVRLISEIGDKTKVINEIVFQTKLLAFNASVEAARAGEHGRGFAVVAEEVESLAKMSGTASKEISDLLERSVQQVGMIVEQGRQRLEDTLDINQKKIDHGTSTALRCKESFETIVSQMESVKSTSEQNANAIHETVKGLDDISKAIEHLEESTISNSETSRVTSLTSEELSEHLSELKISINQVNRVIGA